MKVYNIKSVEGKNTQSLISYNVLAESMDEALSKCRKYLAFQEKEFIKDGTEPIKENPDEIEMIAVIEIN